MYWFRLMGPAHDAPLSSHVSLRCSVVASTKTTSSFEMATVSIGVSSVDMVIVYWRPFFLVISWNSLGGGVEGSPRDEGPRFRCGVRKRAGLGGEVVGGAGPE